MEGDIKHGVDSFAARLGQKNVYMFLKFNVFFWLYVLFV